MLVKVVLPVVLFIFTVVTIVFWAKDREKYEQKEHQKYMKRK